MSKLKSRKFKTHEDGEYIVAYMNDAEKDRKQAKKNHEKLLKSGLVKNKKKAVKPKKAKMYLVCCLSETDGDPHFTYLDAYSIKKLGLHKDPDCTIIDGKIIDASKLK